MNINKTYTAIALSLSISATSSAALTALADPTTATTSSIYDHSSISIGNLYDSDHTTIADGDTNSTQFSGLGTTDNGFVVIKYDMGATINLGGIYFAQRHFSAEQVTDIKFWVTNTNPGPVGSDAVAMPILGTAPTHTLSSITANTASRITEYDFGSNVGSGQYVVMRLQGKSGSDHVGADELVLAAVPEPSSAALLGLGGLALILRRRK